MSLPVFRTLARRLARWRDGSCDALGVRDGLRVLAASAGSIEVGKRPLWLDAASKSIDGFST